MYNCKVLADSINQQNDRITTFKITIPRIVLSEFNTHRMFSRNSASSRAIPFNKMVSNIVETPFIPLAWQTSHKGMQGFKYHNKEESFELEQDWLNARDCAIISAEQLSKRDVTKQLTNRLLEPFMWHTIIVTSTEWENFFKLRCPQYKYNGDGKIYRSKKDALLQILTDTRSQMPSQLFWNSINQSHADIHIQKIAEMMWDNYNASKPKRLKYGEWHIPFGDNIDMTSTSADVFKYEDRGLTNEELEFAKVKIATARCARISYETLGDNPKIDYEADIKLHDMLAESGHWSPFEHCAKAMNHTEYDNYILNHFDYNNNKWVTTKGICRNFKGFIQYRAMMDFN